MPKSSYSLKFTPKAGQDLEEIYAYISEKLSNNIAAGNLLVEIENSLMKLKEFPKSGSLISDELLKSKGYRKMIVENYIAFYLVNEPEKQVVIMRILYGARNYSDFL